MAKLRKGFDSESTDEDEDEDEEVLARKGTGAIRASQNWAKDQKYLYNTAI
jgi:hypothetical protein